MAPLRQSTLRSRHYRRLPSATTTTPNGGGNSTRLTPHPPPRRSHGSWLHRGRGPFVIYRERGFARYATATASARPNNGNSSRVREERQSLNTHSRIIAIAFPSIVPVQGTSARKRRDAVGRSHFRSHKSFLRGRSIRLDVILPAQLFLLLLLANRSRRFSVSDPAARPRSPRVPREIIERRGEIWRISSAAELPLFPRSAM